MNSIICTFDSLDQFRVLDRLALPLPKNYTAAWRLDVVHLQPERGDRVFCYFGNANVSGGCFAPYPDNICRTVVETESWCNGAWPYLRKVPGPHHWLTQGPAVTRFITGHAIGSLVDLAQTQLSTECWSVRYREGKTTMRWFAWFEPGGVSSTPWGLLQGYCQQLIQQTQRYQSTRRAS